MRIIKKILVVFAIILLVIAAIGFLFFPSNIHVERRVTIYQKQNVVYNYVSDMENWNKWNVWYTRDTSAKYSYEGPKSGVGALIKWDSRNKEVGKGSLAITTARPDSLIMEDLNITDQSVAKITFRFSSEENATLVTWSLDMNAGANPLMRIMGSFMNGMVGKDFEGGLKNLKRNTEALMIPDSSKVQ